MAKQKKNSWICEHCAVEYHIECLPNYYDGKDCPICGNCALREGEEELLREDFFSFS